MIEWPVGEEGFAGGLLEEDLVVAEEVVDVVALFEGDEENLALAGAPDLQKIGVGEEDVRGVGEGGAEEHGGGAAVDEVDVFAEVEGDGGAVGLVAVEEDLVCRGRWRGWLRAAGSSRRSSAEESMGAKRTKAMCAAMRKTVAGEGDGGGCGEVAAFCAQQPCDGGTDGEGDGGECGGQAQRGEAGAGEVEEVRHGEGVVADAAVGEEIADVGDEGEVAGAPEAVGEGDGGGDADDGEGGVGEGDPAAGGCVFGRSGSRRGRGLRRVRISSGR